MPERIRRPLVVTSLLILGTILACSPCGWLSQSNTRAPDRPLEISQDAALRFEEKLQGSWESQGEGQFRLQFTDEELTSYVNLKLREASGVPLSDPRVWLTRGKIYVGGELSMQQLPVTGQAVIVASARVVEDKIRIFIEQANIGQVPVPKAILSTLEDSVNTALAQAQLHVRILKLEILEGEAIIAATPN